jgi:hypothetical protein
MTTKQKIFIAVSTVAVIGIVVMIVKSSKGTVDSGGINYDRAGTCKYIGKWVRDSSNSVYYISGRANGQCVKVKFDKLIASGFTPMTSDEIWAQSEKIEDGWLSTLAEG